MFQECKNSWHAPNGSYLIPDAAVAVLDIESDAIARLWLTIVVEVEKVSRWFLAGERMVKIALLRKSTGEEPLVNSLCFIVVFRCRTPSFVSPYAGAGFRDDRTRYWPRERWR